MKCFVFPYLIKAYDLSLVAQAFHSRTISGCIHMGEPKTAEDTLNAFRWSDSTCNNL